MKRAASIAALAAMLVAVPAAAQDRNAARRTDRIGLSFTTGADYSVGDYGGPSDTKILVVPFSLRAKTGALRVSATVPYLRIDGPGNIVGGGEGGPIIIDPNAANPRQVREGLGDLSLGATYSLPPEGLGGFEVDVGARVKLPTSSSRERLGTGKTDFAVSLDVSRPIGSVAPFVTVGYRIPGDPDGFDLRNTVSTSVGSTFQLGSVTAIASYDYSGATSRLSEDSHSLFGALSGPVAKGLNLTGYSTVGFSEGAPDFGVGLLVSIDLT